MAVTDPESPRALAETREPDLERLGTTPSGIPVKDFYGPDDVDGEKNDGGLAEPGTYPFTRGKFPRMYRDRLWITRNLSGLTSPQATNERLRYLMTQGQTGIALVPDTPTQLAIDGDHPLGRQSVGSQGVPISSLGDMNALFDGLPVDRLTASFSVPGIAATVVMPQYVAMARARGFESAALRGSVQNDPLQACLTSYDPRNPLELTMRVTADSVAWAANEMPNFHPITVNAYDLRETGMDAVQEVGFTLAITRAYIAEVLERSDLTIDDFGHRLLIIANANNDLFEEVAKFRAMRRLWARMMREFGARNDRTCALTLAVHTAGTTLTKEQPINNVVRGTIQGLAALLGGCQGLDLSCYDEATSLPSELAAAVALRTQQILAWESGVTRTADPLGGSYYVEALTNEIEERALSIVDEINEQGGMVEAIESGWAEAEIRRSLVKLRDDIANGDQPVVGVNYFTDSHDLDTALPVTPTHLERSEEQVTAVEAWKSERDTAATKNALRRLLDLTCDRTANVMPGVYDATLAGATVGEIIGTIRRGYDLPFDPFSLTEHPFGS